MTDSVRVHLNIPKKINGNGRLKMMVKQGQPALVTEAVTGENVNTIPFPCSLSPLNIFYTFSTFKMFLINYLIFIESL